MNDTRARARWSHALALLALGACSDDVAPQDAGADATAADGPVGWADKGQLQCAPGIPANCCELMRQHEGALAEAKPCTAGSTTCTKLVAGDLPCGCKTFVDSSKSAAVDKMTQLEQQWKAAGCPSGQGCSSCKDPKSGSCELLGIAQKCVDIL